MNEKYPVIPGAEAWSAPGHGARAPTGVVVSHGFTGNPASVREMSRAFAEAGHAVELIRLPGHGTSWRDMAKTRYVDWQAHAEAACERLRARCDRVFLAGLSLGGTIGMDIAGRRPELLDGVVTVNASILPREGIVAKLAPLLAIILPVVPSAAADLVKNDATREGVDEKAYAWVPAKAGNSFLKELPGIRARLRGLKVPLLVAYGAHDRSVNNANSLAIPDLVGPEGSVELLPLPNSRHLATMDVDRQALYDAALTFFS